MCRVTEPCSSPVSSPCNRSKPMVNIVMDADNRKRRVRFGANVEHVFEKEFTKADHRFIWYDGDEFAAIKNEIYDMIRSIKHCDCTREWHWRGFEHIQQKRPRKEIRRKHSEDLLYFHKVMSVGDPVGLGLMASSSSRESTERARELGIVDENEAYAVYNESDDDQIPDVVSVSESESDEDELLTGDILPLRICRGDEKTVHLLQDIQYTYLPAQDEGVLSLLSVPCRLALMLFPCFAS